MDKLTATGINARVTHAIGGVIFKEQQVSFLQVARRSDLRPAAHGGEPRGAVAACADSAGAQAKVH